MQLISLEELQENFDYVIDMVEDGESFTIVVDGEERAVLIPYNEYEEMQNLIKKCEEIDLEDDTQYMSCL